MPKRGKMEVLMLGWEFPPYSSGGLGTACFGLTKGLSNHNVNVTFVLPKAPEDATSHVKIIGTNNLSKFANVKFEEVNSIIHGYMTSEEYDETIKSLSSIKKNSMDYKIYGKNLFQEVYRFSKKAAIVADQNDFDVIHAHDWMTYKAGIEAKKQSGKPLVLHIHATEFDRTGGNPNQIVYNIEREGFECADRIIAVSNFTRNKVINQYGIAPEKVKVVHNAVDTTLKEKYEFKTNDKIVLFLGRITIQKGPDYFLYAAKKVIERDPNVKFVVAGTGDMERFMIEKAAEMGIANKVFFTGFLTGSTIDRAYQMADLYVMPSVSEPFGITPLEAMKNNTPVLISKQSGVSEVISQCLKVDFWDIEEMANKILAVLNYPTLRSTLRDNGFSEVQSFNWDIPAAKCIEVYKDVIEVS